MKYIKRMHYGEAMSASYVYFISEGT